MQTVQLENPLTTTNYTAVFHEAEFEFNAPHHFTVYERHQQLNPTEAPSLLASINFQKGPIKEAGVNGIHNEDLLAMVIARLEGFQNSEYKCRENAVALTKLEEALMWLRKRTIGRQARGVEGTHTV